MMELARLLEMVRAGLMVRTHSGQVEPGEVFVAMPGSRHDGSQYIGQALSRGAGIVVAGPGVELPAGAKALLVAVEDPRLALGELARAYFHTGQANISLVGFTGTNGKTTCTYLGEHLLSVKGRKVGVLGTVSYRWPGHFEDAPLTTPDCWRLHAMLAEMAKAGVDTVLMEVSSHALEQHRVAGLDFEVAVLTNLTQDHLDYHGDMESYYRAKRRLFTEVPRIRAAGQFGQFGKTGVINYDDPYGQRLLAEHSPAIAYGLGESGQAQATGAQVLRGSVLRASRQGMELKLSFKGQSLIIDSPLVGRHNATNLLAVVGAGLALGLPLEEMTPLSGFEGVSGRLERIENKSGLDIFVDYAHTPDALENVQRALKELDFKRLIVVFGCGGDRDRAKRPRMAQAVAKYADVAVLTSDNPRTEDPRAIIEDARPGLAGCPKVIVEVDRKKAIEAAIGEMTPGDVLLVAGKGHESYQIIGTEKRPFSDAAVIREAIG